MYVMENDPAFGKLAVSPCRNPDIHFKRIHWKLAEPTYADKQIRLMIIRRDDEVTLGTIDITDYALSRKRSRRHRFHLNPIERHGICGRRSCSLCEYAFEFLLLQTTLRTHTRRQWSQPETFAGNGFEQSGLLKLGGWYPVKVIKT